MDIQGEQLLAVPREAVWRALNDPAVLRRCLPGCDSFEPDGENRFRVAMQATVGPIRTRFTGRLHLTDIVPPRAYALSFEGSGGVAGFGRGTAQVALEEVGPQATRLRYTAQAQVGGKLAQVGARLIDGVTRKLADDFFARFSRELGATPARQEAGGAVAVPGEPGRAAVTAPGALPVAPAASAHPPGWTLGGAGGVPVLAAAVSATAAAVSVLAALFIVVAGR